MTPAHPRKRTPARSRRAPSRKHATGAEKQRPGLQRPQPEPQASRDLAHQIAALLLDKKAADVLILNVHEKASYADFFVIASGESERQVSAMAEYLQEKLSERQLRPLGVEGQESGSWVLLDFGEVVAHLFFSETRAFYDLEGLWADAPREKVA